MSDLFWPGDERAGDCFTPAAFLHAMVRVEEEWLAVLVGQGVAPASAAVPVGRLITDADIEPIAATAEGGGNPVIGLVKALRSRLEERDGPGDVDAATWLHRGLTSQDVVDTAMMICVRDTVASLEEHLAVQAGALARLARDHRGSVMAGRTLGQQAVPITFGLKAAGWLHGLTGANRRLRGVAEELPAQAAGAAGTMAAAIELGESASAAKELARRVGLDGGAFPWHTSRGAVTAIGDALVGLADVWGQIASEVATLSRTEIGELTEPTGPGRGGSSTMPHKANPVLSVLVRRHAMTAPQQAATLHLCAALVSGERPDGAWHAEWDALRGLARHSVVAASQVAELLTGLRVHADRMRTNCSEDLLAEQASLTELSGKRAATRPEDYLGANDDLIDNALERAGRLWKELG